MQQSRQSLDAPGKTSFLGGSDKSSVRSAPVTTSNNPPASLEGYGESLFKGAVAAPYLNKQGLRYNVLDDTEWTRNGLADKVAAAVLDWARDRGASVYCHWFQPLGSSGVRHGLSACVQISMVDFNADGSPRWEFKGKNLLFGETDGSSYMNGGLRSTHAAGGYTVIDATSPIFLRDDTIFIPACLTSYSGLALDEKLPLLKAADALSREGVRLLSLLGLEDVDKVIANIGLEQEFFFVDREAYLRRPDLQLAGRTVMGRDAPRGQEMGDHYMAPPSLASRPIAAMKDFQRQCFKMGIPMKTRHREVAPGQHEFAPLFGAVSTQIDQNLMAMQILDEVAIAHGLTALLQEKPFQNVNGSGKHNNWSLAMGDGTNLLNVSQLAAATGSHEIFPVVMAAILKAINDNGDLMRLAIAVPGNDFRLGACEAPPSIISTHLGEDMTSYLQAYIDGSRDPYIPNVKMLDLKCSVLPSVIVPAEDRNRTSPFPYGGHRFEFRAVGSSQNVSLVNTVLATICAKAFKEFSDAIESGVSARDVATASLKESFRVIFNGNGYDLANQAMLTERGLWRIDSGVEAILRFKEKKNVDLFESLGVLTAEECAARGRVMLSHYVGLVEIEANCMISMINQHIIPSYRASCAATDAHGHRLISRLQTAVSSLHTSLHEMHAAVDTDDACTALENRARLARNLRLETMVTIRWYCDEAEENVPADKWTLATYKELLFLDMH